MVVQFEKIHDRSGSLIDFNRYVKMMYNLQRDTKHET